MKDLSNDAYAMFLWVFFVFFCFFFFLSNFFYKSIWCGYSFELHQVDAIQIGTHNICLDKEVDRRYSVIWRLESLGCMLIGVCAVIRLKTVIEELIVLQLKKMYLWTWVSSENSDQHTNLWRPTAKNLIRQHGCVWLFLHKATCTVLVIHSETKDS